MSTPQNRSWARRRSVRALAVAAVVVGPVAAVPLLMTGYSAASSSERAADTAAAQVQAAPRADVPQPCINGGTPGSEIKVLSFDGPTGTATFEMTGPGCQTVTLALYSTPPLGTDGKATYPQSLVTYKTVYLTEANEPVTVSLGPASACASELDLIFGEDQSGAATVQQALTGPYYADHGLLLDHQDFLPAACTAPTTTPPTNPTTTPPTNPTTTPPTNPTTTPPTNPTTTPPTNPTTTPPTTPTDTISTTVESFSTSRPPTTTPPTTGTPTSTKSTVVLPTSTSRAPGAPTDGSLPYTGGNVPVRAGVMSGFALLSLGGALVLFAGRSRRRPGAYRAH